MTEGPVSVPWRTRWEGLLYAAPALVLFGLFVLAPLAHTGYLSLFKWNGVGPMSWVGISNYANLLGNEQVQQAFGHGFSLVLFISALPIAIGLLLTGLLSRRRVRGMPFFRAALFLPQVVAFVVVGVSWRWLLSPDGPVNSALESIGLADLARPWLGDFDTALVTVGLIGTWLMTGLALVLFLSGVQKIEPELYDAVRVDGAGSIREFFTITLPGLRHELIVAVILTVTIALRAFDIIYVLTHGGPGSSTTVPAFEIYRAAFVSRQVGVASATGVVLALTIIAISLAILRIGRRWGT